MKNQACPKPDCMYLHELGDGEASFTKEEMHQGKHQEYEKRLHDALIAQMQQQSQQQPTTGSSNPATASPDSSAAAAAAAVGNGTGSVSNGALKSSSGDSMTKEGGNNGTVNGNSGQKEAWPSLSTSPVTIKENKSSTKGSEYLNFPTSA
jgi:CCR4-NOT transcription complex subunit 4